MGASVVFFFGDPKSDFVFSNLVPISRIMLRCIYGCQKWIPDKILHRNNDPFFFSTCIFSLKKIILKMKNVFFSRKPCMGAKGGHFEENMFFIYKIIFFDEKIKVEKKIGSSFRCRILSGIHFWHL